MEKRRACESEEDSRSEATATAAGAGSEDERCVVYRRPQLSHPLASSILKTTQSISELVAFNETPPGGREVRKTSTSTPTPRRRPVSLVRRHHHHTFRRRGSYFRMFEAFLVEKTSSIKRRSSSGSWQISDHLRKKSKDRQLELFKYREPPSLNMECLETTATTTSEFPSPDFSTVTTTTFESSPTVVSACPPTLVSASPPPALMSACPPPPQPSSSMPERRAVAEESRQILSPVPLVSCVSHKRISVEVRAVFLKIGDIDTLNEKFYAEAFIEAKWIDPALSIADKYNSERHFNPQLYVLNCLGELKQQVWSNQYTVSEYERLEHDVGKKRGSTESAINPAFEDPALLGPVQSGGGCGGGKQLKFDLPDRELGCVIVERRRIAGQFYQTLDLKNFPADVQELTITLCTPKPVADVELKHSKTKASSVNIKCFADSQQWRLYRHIIVNEFLRDSVFSNETYSAINLTLNAARRPTFYYWNAFFLIFLITLSSLSIFSIRCDRPQNRIQTTCTLLLTSVTFKWVVTNRSLPFISYMTSLDKYSLACMLFICAQCIWHSIISSLMGIEEKCANPFSHYDHAAFVAFCLLFLLLNLIFLVWLMRAGYEKRRRLNRLETDYTNSIMGKRSCRLKSMLYGI